MSASITAPRGLQTLNPSPEISRYYNKVDAPYINTAQVLSEVLLPVRYPGQTFLVVDEEWWFKSGKLDADLVLKQDSGTGITDLDYTPSPTQGTVTSSTGTDAIISLADNTNAGLMSPSDKETLYDNVIYRSGTEAGKPVTGDVEIGDTNGISTEEIDGMRSRMFCDSGKWYINILGVDTNPEFQFNPDKGILSNQLFDLDNDEKVYLQKGHIVQLEEDVFNLQLANTGDETTITIQTKRPLKTIVGKSIEGSGNVLLDTGDVTDITNKRYVTDIEKTAITHSNRSILDNITEAFTTGLKTSYDSAVTWISTNGTNLLNHLLRTDNPHSVTKTQVGLGSADDTSDVNKPISTATQTALDNKQATLTDTNFGTFTTSVGNKETQADNDVLAYVDVTSGKWVKQTFSKLVDYLKGFFQTSRIIVTSDITAVNGSVYHNNGNNTFTDPTPENNKGFYVLNVSGSPTIGGNTYSVETYLFRYYNGTTWITNVIKNGTTQKDVVASRDYLPSDHNCLLKIKANVTLTIPASGLPDNFTLVARTFSGATLTNAKAVGVTTDAPTGLVLPPFKMQTLFKDAATNTYIISGELTT